MIRKRAAIYCRVSTIDQTCDRQEFELLQFAERMNCEVVFLGKETASGAKNDRKIRQEIIDLARKRAIDVVLVAELTRWGRSTSDLIQTVNDLFSKNVSLVPLSGEQFDLNTPVGKLMLAVFAALAQFERDLVVERVRSGMNEARRKGKRFGRPEGYNKYSKFQSRILALKAEGYSVRKIAKQLSLSPTTVQKVLSLNAK